ncbi:MAG: STAS domain-containing protein, partial [Alphaproteobacteria bacterium]
MHAVFLLLFMLFAMDIVSFIPMATLAAILFMVAWSMSEVGHFIHIYKLSAADRSVLLLTFVLTVFVDLTVAIGIGVTLASLLFMHQMSKAVEIKSEKRRMTDLMDNQYEDEAQRMHLPPDVEVFRITGPVFFGVANDLMETLKIMGQMPKVLILRMRLVPYLDASGATVIANVVKQCLAKGTKVILSGPQAQPQEILKKAGVIDNGAEIIFSPDYQTSLNLAQTIAR